MRWKVNKVADLLLVQRLREELGVDRTVATLLAQRGISSFEEAKTFFRPDLNQLHDPFLMKGMMEAIERIHQAIENKEKIMIYGDYDVDGTTAVALVHGFFASQGVATDYYIPDRYAEGYGISFKGIDVAEEMGVSLIIALDCGIKAVDKVAYANRKNIDFIICDHHLPGDKIPEAVAVLDPKQKDCPYPFKELSGCGIGYKLAQAYLISKGRSQDVLEQFIDLVAVSIAADIVPLVGENRVLCFYGLKQINFLNRFGFRSMFDLNKINREITVTDLVFTIAPRINAAGRLKHGKMAVELLVSPTAEQADVIAKQIDVTNTDRRGLDKHITDEAIAMIEASPEMLQRKSTVVYHDGWHKGVVGIVASRLVERFYRPTIVLTHTEGKLTGSARSVKDFDVYLAIEACSEYLEQFGGHKYAAGLTMRPENITPFIQKFEEVVSSSITSDMLVPEIEVDLDLDFHEITPKFFRILKQFGPHGPENMSPLFVTQEVYDTGAARVVGTNHLKLELYQEKNPGRCFHAIGFEKGDYLKWFKDKLPVTICYAVQENVWNGKTSLQLQIKDIKLV